MAIMRMPDLPVPLVGVAQWASTHLRPWDSKLCLR